MKKRIYLASSWRNPRQPEILAALRRAGHEVYDFRNPRAGDNGFHWSEIDPYWHAWTPGEYREALKHPIADHGFASDFEAMQRADTCVLLLPSGRSAHLEAGWCKGIGKGLVILLDDAPEPELMYKMADAICTTVDEMLAAVEAP